ncbi:MAG: helicase C-terminal domain-containing protein [Candidatus Hodarchaeales archaeon]
MTKIIWAFCNNSKQIIPPLRYENGADQESIINELLEALDENDLVFLQGGVGTGKSIIALHLISHYKKGIIAVPTKVLEDQYVQDYCGPGSNYILTENGKRLNVNNLRGRTNFLCPNPPTAIKTRPVDCGNSSLYCTKKPKRDKTRLSLGIQCNYWSPVLSANKVPLIIEKTRKSYPYESISGMKIYCESETPCPYYIQFRHFVTSGAIIMNSAKWEAETWILRKPKVPIEIIDEGDDFLDGLSYKTSFDLRTLQTLEREEMLTPQEYNNLEIEFQRIINENIHNREYELTTKENILSFINFIHDLLKEAESSRLMGLQYKLNIIIEYSAYAWVHITNTKSRKALTFFIPRMDITLNEIRQRSGKLVFMSATSHSDVNFQNIFGVLPRRIYAQEENPGQLYAMVPEEYSLLNVNNSNWKNNEFRDYYWEVLEDQINRAERPCYVLVHALRYLPRKYQPSSEERGHQYWFRNGLEGVKFSTKMDRGIDLKDDLCRSLILLKYPIPYLGDVVLKTLRKEIGEEAFWQYVLDMANRELLQQCGRAVRNKNDWCKIYSPDNNVIHNLMNIWKGKIVLNEY